MSLIEIEHVTVEFGDEEQRFVALQDVTMEVEESEFVCLIGPSGCGKTTLLNAIAGFVQPVEGSIRVAGKSGRAVRGMIGYVFQEYALFPWYTAQQNVAFGLKMKGLPPAQVDEVSRRYLSMVGLEAFAGRYPHQLSGGMKQRVAIARALAYEPKVLLMDEPFGALDALTRDELLEQLHAIWQRTRATILYVTHNVAEAVFLADTVYVFGTRPGRILERVDVSLPRPRDRFSPPFIQLERRLVELLGHAKGTTRAGSAGKVGDNGEARQVDPLAVP